VQKILFLIMFIKMIFALLFIKIIFLVYHKDFQIKIILIFPFKFN